MAVKKFKFTKAGVEKMLADAGAQPADRKTFMGTDVLLSDGFVQDADRMRRFGASRDEFPLGCFCTIWWIARGENIEIGRPLIFDALHDPQYDIKSRKTARINRAFEDAKDFIKRRKKFAASGMRLH
jgi:hypothetical protein